MICVGIQSFRETVKGKMEEITLRFEIIRLAVELGDFDTIDLQCRKLQSLSLDERLDEIIELLESRNYRQALYGMKFYHQSLKDDFFDEEEAGSEEERARRVRGLLVSDGEEDEDGEERVLDLDDILRLSSERVTRVPEPEPEGAVESEEAVGTRRRGESGSEEVPEVHPRSEENISEKMETMEKESDGYNLVHSSSHPASQVEEESGALEEVSTESLSNTKRMIDREKSTSPDKKGKRSDETAQKQEAKGKPISGRPEPETKEAEKSSGAEKSAVQSTRRPWDESDKDKSYPPISYIGQKFRNMMHQFPPLERSEVLVPEVEKMREKIATEGYTDAEIEAFLKKYQEYKKLGERAGAAQVLLLAAATESKFAQFLLARELFKGEILQKDHAESFTQINTLADQNFAEAICDLGQFYEYGIGIGKDREMALLLYEEAAELGVARARKHYERLKNSRGIKGLLGKVKVPIKLPKKTK